MIILKAPHDNVRPEFEQFVYGGSDTYATRLLHDKLAERASPFIYNLQCALLAPTLAQMIRGLPVNEDKARELFRKLRPQMEEVALKTQNFVQEKLGWGGPETRPPFNPGSDAMMLAALHGKRAAPPCPACGWTGTEILEYDHAVLEVDSEGAYLRYKSGPRKGLPKHRLRVYKDRLCKEKHIYRGFGTRPYRAKHGDGYTVDRNSLGKLIVRERGAHGCPEAAELAMARLDYKELEKPLAFITALRGPTGRYMYELGIGMTDTFRFNSKANVWGEGTNGQNQHTMTRGMFEAGPGRLLGANDQSKAESHWAAALSGDEAYLLAHEGTTDTHAFVAHMMWPDLDWPADETKWKAFAEATSFSKVMGLPFKIPKDNIREIAKREQHGVTRGQTPDGFAALTWMSRKAAEQVQQRFFDFAPGLASWMEMFEDRSSKREVIHVGTRNPPEGFEARHGIEGPAVVMHLGPGVFWWRSFKSDPEAGTTHRNMVAFALQSPVTVTTHLGTLAIWNDLDSHELTPGVGMQLLSDQHDEVLYEFDEADADIPEQCRQRMLWTYEVNGRPLCVGVGKKSAKTWKELK